MADTVFRLPIKISGFIEIVSKANDLDVGIVVDKYDYDYGPWPRVSPFGDDTLIVQMENDSGRHLSGNADYVDEMRKIAERRLDGFSKWRISKTVGEDITKGTQGE